MERRLIIVLAIIPVIFIVGFLVYGLTNEKGAGDKIVDRPAISRPAPDFTFPDLDGRMVSLSDYRGKVVFLNIWATWCPSCKEEMPSIYRLYEHFKDNNDFQVLTISIDILGKEVIIPHYKEMGISLPTLMDPRSEIKNIYGITGVPETFIIDKKGNIVYVVLGPRKWDSDEYISYIENLINES